MLLQKIYEVDPLVYTKCGSRMKVIAVITEHSSLKKILKHVGLWNETIEARGPAFHSISNETKAGRISNEMLLGCIPEQCAKRTTRGKRSPRPAGVLKNDNRRIGRDIFCKI